MTAAAPDPFRDQLADTLVQAVGSQMPRGKVWNLDKVTDALMPVIAAEIARVQAAAADKGRPE